MSEPHPFDRAIAIAPQGGDSFAAATSPAYANMIGPYGGITAAQALAAVLRHPQRLGEPVAFTINFAAAIADGAFTAVARPARTNRSTQHWSVELQQDAQVVATATAVTALRRPDAFSGHEAAMPDVPRPQDVERTHRRGVEWLHRYEMRFLAGGLPRFDGALGDSSVSRLWVRDDPPRPLDFASLTALADVFFPRIWLRRARHTPLGTVTMTVYFHATGEQLAAVGTGYLLAQVRGQGFAAGFFDHAGQLWDESGALLATTHQVYYHKE